MPDDPTANAPLSLSQILADELESLGHPFSKSAPAADADARLREVYRAIRDAQPERSALCLSGGGIRSATFSLGVAQALASSRLLRGFDYLSTVSGGGYLGSMLSARIHHLSAGKTGADGETTAVADVERELAGADEISPTRPEPAPLTHLRRFSNYISPKLGIFSADGWMLIATALRNLLLNWTVIVSVIAAALVLPWFGLLSIFAQISPEDETLFQFVPAALLGIVFACFACATAYPGFDAPGLGNFRWRQRSFLLFWLAPMLVGMLALASWWALKTNTDPHSLEWIQSWAGLWDIVRFLALASIAGVVPCTICVGIRDWRDARRKHTMEDYIRVLVVIIAALVVVGAPAALMLRAVAAWMFPAPAKDALRYMTFAPVVMLHGFFLMNCLFVGLTSRWTHDDDREWWARAAGWIGAVSAGWLCVYLVALWAPNYAYLVPAAFHAPIAASGGVIGFISAKFAASEKTPGFLKDNPQIKRTLLLSTAAILFFAVIAWAVSRLISGGLIGTVPIEYLGNIDEWKANHQSTDGVARLSMVLGTPDLYPGFARCLGIIFGALLLTAAVMGFFINVNRFSLHATYRNRLVRAYLGAARAERRHPHPFTGFDPDDNIPMHKLAHPRPLHVVNMTLNLVGGGELAWQERMADSFTATRLHAGNHRVGYRPADEYAQGIHLGTVLAISGAAASPNQGYHSSPMLTFLMTLFNVRLGWWLGNPGVAGRHTWKHGGPVQATLPLFTEALGLTNEDRPYVYLSDGGHFENLAIYEMLLRRCRRLVVVDAEEDGDYTFEGLGGAVRKARIDMGIPIEFRGLDRLSKKLPHAERRTFAIGRIDYNACDGGNAPCGYILYLKPLLTGGEPTDVRNYASGHEAFPQESTIDQFFSESQFESYRVLGRYVASAFIDAMPSPPATLADVFTHVEKLWRSCDCTPPAAPASTG